MPLRTLVVSESSQIDYTVAVSNQLTDVGRGSESDYVVCQRGCTVLCIQMSQSNIASLHKPATSSNE
jgi:hypothetical protein